MDEFEVKYNKYMVGVIIGMFWFQDIAFMLTIANQFDESVIILH